MPEVETWTGLYAPKGLARSGAREACDAIAKTLADPVSVKRLTDVGAGVPKPERQGGTYMQKTRR